MVVKISTAELARRLGDPKLVVVDIRPAAAFNGWRLQGERRGGHIHGAVSCPASWTDRLAPDELSALLERKGITPDKTVVVYGYGSEVSSAMAERLLEMGYPDVLVYEAGLGEWAAEDALPMVRLPRYEKLVYPAWLHGLIHGRPVEGYEGDSFTIFHVNFGVPDEYAAGHIPGAVYLDTNALESSTDWNRRPADELEAALLAHGITHDRMVVLYGRHNRPDPEAAKPGQNAGQIAAARAAAILMYAGVEDVRLLDGGYDAWVAAGYETETEARQPVPAQDFGVQIPAHPEYMVDLEEAKAILSDRDGELVSIRSWPEFIGEASGYNYIGPRGRIAGAVWGNCGTDAYHMQNYRNVDNTMREFHEIEAFWQEAGITADKRVAFYCGTGWRASETFFYAYLLGWDRMAVYDGGWYEWSSDPANPVEVGEP